MQFRRVIDYLEGICILHNDPGIAQNLEITEQKSELTITNLTLQPPMSVHPSVCLSETKHHKTKSQHHKSTLQPTDLFAVKLGF